MPETLTLQRHERALAVIDAVRDLGRKMNACEPCDPEFRALWDALAAFDDGPGEGGRWTS